MRRDAHGLESSPFTHPLGFAMFLFFTHILAFAAGAILGAYALRNNPLKGAGALDALDALYQKEKAKITGK